VCLRWSQWVPSVENPAAIALRRGQRYARGRQEIEGNSGPKSYDSAMLERLTLFMLCVISWTGCQGQRDAGSFTYKLHKPQNDNQYSTLHTMPDGALLMVS